MLIRLPASGVVKFVVFRLDSKVKFQTTGHHLDAWFSIRICCLMLVYCNFPNFTLKILVLVKNGNRPIDRKYNMKKTDRVFAAKKKNVPPFVFDKQVADVFPDMLKRSIPGYDVSLRMTALFASRLGKDNSRMYDLGSSLSASSLALAEGARAEHVQIIAVDNSPAMIRRSGKIIRETARTDAIHLVCADIRDINIKNASLVVLNYTLQFLDPARRMDLIRSIYSGLLPGGGLLLSEKIAFDEAEEQDFQTDWYHAFKEFNGYSKLEISQKRTALEKVLIPESWPTHQTRLQKAGFKTVHLWQRFFSFASIIAIK